MKKALPAIYVFAAATSIGFLSTPAMSDSKATKSDMDATIKQYILDHPDVILDSLKKGQAKEEADANKKAALEIKNHRSEITNGKYSPVAGNPKGNVTLVEFFDYHCGYCRKMLPTVTEAMKDDPNLRMSFKEFPILSEDSELAARAALAFSHLKPAKYFAYHTALMGMSGKYEEATLIEEAKKLGANEDDMKKEMNSEWVKDELQKNKDLATKLNVRGTPAFIVGDTFIPGAASLEDMKKAIDGAHHPAKPSDKTADKSDSPDEKDE